MIGGRSIGPALASARRQQRYRARLDDERQRRPAEQHDAERDARRRPAPARFCAHRGEDLGDDVTDVAGEELVGVATQQQNDEEDAANDRDRQQQFQRGFGDELDRHERPVGGCDERPPLQRGLESWWFRH